MLGRVITRRLLGLVLVDAVAVFLALRIAPALYPVLKGGSPHFTTYLLNPWWQAAVVIQLYLFYLVDLYEGGVESSPALLPIRAAIAVAAMTGILMAVYFFNYRQSRGIILFYAPSAFVSVVGARLLMGQIHPALDEVRHVMVLCNGQPSAQEIALAQAAADGTHRLKGVLVHSGGAVSAPAEVPVRRVEEPRDLRRIVEEEGVDEIVLASGCEEHRDLVRELARLSYQGVLLSNPMTFFERIRGKLPCEYLTDASFLFCHMEKPRRLYGKVKRLSDMVLSGVGLVLSFPVCLLAGALIKATSKGPVFFRQARVGLDGRPFTLIKFRTMREDAEAASGPQWATRGDPRVTRIGGVLRRTRIDELPQLLNVLRGDMSLIGPRPERPVFVEQFEREIPYYQERHAVRPGITGWAQVNQGYAAGTDETKEKLGYDLFYLKNQSLTLDLLIAFMTAKKTLRAGGR